jgi:hypothetical protein
MNQQIRKFEQEAIVREVLNKLQAKSKENEKSLMKQSEYKVIQKHLDLKLKLQAEADSLNEQLSTCKESIREQVKAWNSVNPSNFPLNYSESYQGNDTLDFDSSRTWELQQTIGDKIAIALLAPDYKERLATIIDDIANELS